MKDNTLLDVLVYIALFLVVFGVASWLLSPKFMLSNEAAVFIEIAIAVFLACSFFVIQNRNNHRRKQFWAIEAISELQAIMSAFTVIRNKYQDALSDANQNEVVGEVTINQAVDNTKVSIARLNVALTQIADLLDKPAIYRDITKDNYQDFTRLLENAHVIGTQKCYQSIPLYDERIKLIQSFIDRIEAEKHKQVKITRPSM